MPSIIDIVDRLDGKTILDIGAGNGTLCAELHSRGYETIGVEYDEVGCSLAREAHPEIEFFNLGVQDDPAEIMTGGRAGFDLVVSTEVIEHLYSPQLLPRFARRCLKPGGHLLVTTPYHGYLKNLVLSIFGKWDPHFCALWEGGHIKFWSRDSLTTLLRDEGFEVVKFSGVGRVPYLWKSMILLAKQKA